MVPKRFVESKSQGRCHVLDGGKGQCQKTRRGWTKSWQANCAKALCLIDSREYHKTRTACTRGSEAIPADESKHWMCLRTG